MPISKNTKRKICINECGNLDLQIPVGGGDFFSYALSNITGSNEEGILLDERRVFTVSAYMCPKCGYVELYDKE